MGEPQEKIATTRDMFNRKSKTVIMAMGIIRRISSVQNYVKEEPPLFEHDGILAEDELMTDLPIQDEKDEKVNRRYT